MSITFQTKFEKSKGNGGKLIYTFYIQDSALDVEGSLITSSDIQNGGPALQSLVWKIPEGCASHTKTIMEQWLGQCSSAFSTPPPLEKCVANTVVVIDTGAEIPSISSEEEGMDWSLYWVPTRIQIDAPKFILYWAPMEKKENTRIREELFFETASALEEVNLEEFRPSVSAAVPTPAAAPAPIQVDSQLQKDMVRVISAYEKARHFYEKAETYNEKFKKKYGFYAVDEEGSETSSFHSDGWTEYDDDDAEDEEDEEEP